MGIIIRPADLVSERQIIVQTLLRHLTEQSTDRRYHWLYISSPYGLAKAWLAIDEKSMSVIGAAAAFPRRFFFHDKEVPAWVMGDFCFEKAYRSLGPALQLQRACLEVLEFDPGGFCYDFPSHSMAGVYKRLGMGTIGIMQRFAKLLRVDRKVKLKNGAARQLVCSVGNTLLKLASRRRYPRSSIEISIHDGLCGEEFTSLWLRQRGKLGICLERSADYLNWRYLANPLASHEIVKAEIAGRLVGYVIWTQMEQDGSVIDLFGENDPEIIRLLLEEVTERAQRLGLETLSICVSKSHPWLPLLSQAGFHVRNSFAVTFIPSKSFARQIGLESTAWYLMQGDRDS